jgi:hypothetical protein
MKHLSIALPRVALGLLLASGITATVAASAQPAQADVQVSIGIAPSYHWYDWRDRDGDHREWVPVGWAPPLVYGPPAYGYYYGPGYDRPGYWHHDDGDRNWNRDRNRDRDRHQDQDRR